MSKKLTPANVGELGYKQATLCKELRKDIAYYLVYKAYSKTRKNMKRGLTLKKIQNKQAEINKARISLGLPRIQYLQELKYKLRRLIH